MGSSRLKSRRRQDQGLKWPRITIALLSTIGVIDTASITLERWGVLGSLTCPGGGADGCEKVLNSPWGTIVLGNNLALPLSLLGLVSYFTILSLAVIPLLPGLSENKNNLSRKTWWWLFTLSCCMSMFSLILMGLMIFKINAFCFFCILSAIISFLLLGLSFIGGGWDDIGKLVFRGFLLSLTVLLGGLLWASNVDPNKPTQFTSGKGVPPVVQSMSSKSDIALAKHLNNTGVIMYSAYWCPHCHDQKELFGKDAASELTIIECAEDGINSQKELCSRKGITGYPSWEIKDEISSGIKTLEELSNLSGFNGPRDF